MADAGAAAVCGVFTAGVSRMGERNDAPTAGVALKRFVWGRPVSFPAARDRGATVDPVAGLLRWL